ncbi:MAG: DUF1294 domain-containing protein [Planctomycetota bacterium]
MEAVRGDLLLGLQGRRRREGQALSPYLLGAVVALGAANLFAFVLYGIDTWCARLGWPRVSERTLVGVAALGAAPGAWLGMLFFRHKTLKPKFRFGVPLLALVQAGIAVAVFVRSR